MLQKIRNFGQVKGRPKDRSKNQNVMPGRVTQKHVELLKSATSICNGHGNMWFNLFVHVTKKYHMLI